MSVGLMCDCSLSPMAGLQKGDYGHSPRLNDLSGCPQYAADQKRGGLCWFCRDAHALRSWRTASRALHASGDDEPYATDVISNLNETEGSADTIGVLDRAVKETG